MSLEPPLVSVAIGLDTQAHELIRDEGGFALSLLAGDQAALAQHFARSVPPIALWEGVDAREGARGPLLDGALAWFECAVRSTHPAGDHTIFVAEVERIELGRDGRGARLPRTAATRRRDRRGRLRPRRLLLDTEQLWDEVRERLARERGGRWSERAQADMMGMSSPEWSRYMHDVVGLDEPPDEIAAEVVQPDGGALPRVACRCCRERPRPSSAWPRTGRSASRRRPTAR